MRARPGTRSFMALVVMLALATGTVAGFWMRWRPGGAPTGFLPPPELALGQPAQTPSPAPEPSADFSPPRLQAPPPPLSGGATGLEAFADVAELVSPAVVTVVSERGLRDGEPGLLNRFFGRSEPRVRSHGSGFIIDTRGLIVTNNHVIDGSELLSVRLMDGREFEAQVMARDLETDIALLRVDAAALPAVQLGDSDRLRIGEWVLAIGSPFQDTLGNTVTTGIISGKGRDRVNLAQYESFLQTDAAINPGNSGGPLVNLHGQVIGINTAIATQNGSYQGVSFAIPINFARLIIERLMQDGHVTRAWLGVSLEDVDAAAARRLGLPRPEGVRVTLVHRNSPAERAGLRERDVIMRVDGEAAEKLSTFRNRISLLRPGHEVKIEILRQREPLTLQVVLGELTAELRAELERPPADSSTTPGDLGLELQDLSPQIVAQFGIAPDAEGAVVVVVRPKSPADAAGLLPGDLIQSLNRHAVDSVQDFELALRQLPAEHGLVLRLERGSRALQLTVEQPS